MRINDLSYLQKIVQCKSISLAAQKLNISQQRLSYIVQSLEEELGVIIFSRSKKGVDLTTEGSQVLKYSQQILNYYDNMQNIKEQSFIPPQVIFGIDKRINHFLFKKVLAVLQNYPNINFAFQQKNSVFDLIDALANQSIHIALSVSANSNGALDYLYAKAPDSHIQCHPFLTNKIYVLIHKNNPYSSPESFLWPDLLWLYPVVFCVHDSTYKYLLQIIERQRINIFLETDSIDLQLECINNNFAIGIIDYFSLYNMKLDTNYPNIQCIPLTTDYFTTLSLYIDKRHTFLELYKLEKDLRRMLSQIN